MKYLFSTIFLLSLIALSHAVAYDGDSLPPLPSEEIAPDDVSEADSIPSLPEDYSDDSIPPVPQEVSDDSIPALPDESGSLENDDIPALPDDGVKTSSGSQVERPAKATPLAGGARVTSNSGSIQYSFNNFVYSIARAIGNLFGVK